MLIDVGVDVGVVDIHVDLIDSGVCVCICVDADLDEHLHIQQNHRNEHQ